MLCIHTCIYTYYVYPACNTDLYITLVLVGMYNSIYRTGYSIFLNLNKTLALDSWNQLMG